MQIFVTDTLYSVRPRYQVLSVLNDDLVSKGRKVISHYILNCSFNKSRRYCRVSQVVAPFLTLTVRIKLGKLLAPSLLKGRIILAPR